MRHLTQGRVSTAGPLIHARMQTCAAGRVRLTMAAIAFHFLCDGQMDSWASLGISTRSPHTSTSPRHWSNSAVSIGPDAWPELDGRSLVPLMTDESAKWPDRILHTQMHGGNGYRKPGDLWEIGTAMTERWRLVEGRELYDIVSDPSQRNDIAADHPDVVERLTQAHQDWFESVKPGMTPTRILIGSETNAATDLTSQEWVMSMGSPPWSHSHVVNRMIANGLWWPRGRQSWEISHLAITLARVPRSAHRFDSCLYRDRRANFDDGG